MPQSSASSIERDDAWLQKFRELNLPRAEAASSRGRIGGSSGSGGGIAADDAVEMEREAARRRRFGSGVTALDFVRTCVVSRMSPAVR